MKYLTLLFSITILTTILSGCEDRITVIKGCCEERPISSKFGSGYIFIPNVITPNGDQINDDLIIGTDSVQSIRLVEIKNQEGVSIYKASNIPVRTHTVTWDGKVNDEVVRGLYSIEAQVESIDGYLKEFKGYVCVCPCNKEEDEDIIPIKNCKFGSDYTPGWIGLHHGEPLHCFGN